MEEGYVRVKIETSTSIPNLKIITIDGNFDKVTSNRVDEKVLPIIEKEESNIILDTSKIAYLSCPAMLCLIKYSKSMTDQKRILKLVKPSKHIYGTLVAAGIERHFDMYDSLEAAISSF